MTKREWIRALPTRRLIASAAYIISFLAVLVVLLVSRQHWLDRAAALERANLRLEVQQIAQLVMGESRRLADRAAELAGSSFVLTLAEDGSAPLDDRADFLRLANHGVDGFLLISASQGVRFSARIQGDQIIERAANPALIQVAEDLAAGRAAQPAGFVNGEWVAGHAITAPGNPSSTHGWLIIERTLSPAIVARLSRSAGGRLSARQLRTADAATLPASIRGAASVADKGFGVATYFSDDDSAGYAVLRDSTGHPAWEFRVGGGQPSALRTAGSQIGSVSGLVAAGIAIALMLTAGVMLKRHVRRLQSAAGRYKAIVDQASDGIVIMDATSRRVLYTNPAFSGRLGYTSAEILAVTLTDIFADGEASADTVLSRLCEADSQLATNMQLRCKSGVLLEIEVRCNRLEVDGRDVIAFVTRDVSLRKKAEQQLIENKDRLDRMAHHDQLTGLPNRHFLTSFLPQAIAEAQSAGTMLGVVFLDLDRFKHINDTRGHETGDKLLQEVAARLRACVRDSDVVIRMGGDEFVVVFQKVKSYDEVTLGAGRIIDALNRPIIIDQHPLQTTGSVGVSLFPRDGSDMVELLKHSDTAMYQAKDRGRNNVQMFSQIMNRKLKHRVAVEASLREALRLKQLDVHYQPFVNLLTRKVVGLEALIRWKHPEHGMVPADQFIPVAEETGLIVPMGNFVLHRTFQTMSAWRNAGVVLVPVSLNIAPAQLQRGELQTTIATLLKSHGVRPEMLQLEMTERAMFDPHAPAAESRQDTMSKLRDLGIKIAIDDFGTGYSSLSYLKNWRVDSLKIDRSFVRDLVTDSSDLAIVSAIIAIARHLNIQVIAEGIEGYQQAEILRRLGCAIGQGFLFARPMPADECLEYLRANGESEGPAEEEDMLAIFSTGRG